MIQKRKTRLVSRITLVIYALTLLYSFIPSVEVYAAPKSSTRSSAKSSYKSTSSSYSSKSSSSKYKSSSSKSSSKKSYSAPASKSSGSSKSSASSSSKPSKSNSLISKISSKVGKAAKSFTSKAIQTVKTAGSKITQTAKSAVKSIASKSPAPLKEAVKKVYNKAASTLKSVKQKAADKSNAIAKNTAKAVKQAANTVKAAASNLYKSTQNKVAAITKSIGSIANNVKTSMNKTINKTKTIVSAAQQKVKDAITRYKDYAGQSIKKGIQNALSKTKNTISSALGKGKEAFQKAASNPTVQRIGKGVMGALQVVGGVVQTAGGAVISSTGLGAVLGVPVATHGVADVIQGSIKVFNAISGKNIKEINPIEEAYKWAGRSIGGKKGERIASKIFGVTDLALAFVTPGKAVANINKIKEFANAADKMKYLKTMISQSSTVNKIKNLPQFIKNVPRLAKGYAKEIPDIFKRAGSDLAAAPKKMYNAVKGMPTKISDKINDLKKLSSYCKNAVKTEIGAIKTAFGSGYKTYKQTQVSLGITSRSSLIEGLKEGIDKYKDAKNALSASSKGKLAGVVEGGTGNDVYAGVKEASEFLKSQNVPREYRKQILESFDVRTIKMETAGDSTFGIRFYGGEAQEKGRYLFETFSPTTNRNNLALPNQWNTMSGLQQFKVESGTQMITGNAAPQLQYGSQYVGGAKQWYINSLEVLSK